MNGDKVKNNPCTVGGSGSTAGDRVSDGGKTFDGNNVFGDCHASELREHLAQIVGAENVLFEEPMSRHTTFRIGGPARYFVKPTECSQVSELIRYLRAEGIPCFLLGNGSNLLVSDAGYRGVIIQLYKNLNRIEVDGKCIRAQAGALLSAIAACALQHSLTGLEFASGIPGTLGGGTIMNAGAYGGELKDVLRSVRVLTQDGEEEQLTIAQMEMRYRGSRMKDEKMIILEAEMELNCGDAAAIRTRMDELKEQRLSKQPLEYPSAGSTFKRPEGYFAGKLIQDAGLRGFRVGDAQVSEKHCGFVINRGNATAAQVRELIAAVQKKVDEDFHVHLEEEVLYLGFDA